MVAFAVRYVFLSIAIMSFIGCATAPSPEVMKAQTGSFQLPKLPEEGKALVYVVNPAVMHCKGCVYKIFLDNQDTKSEVGSLKEEQYICFPVPPGNHLVFSKSDNLAEIAISPKAGDIVFIENEPSMGMIDIALDLRTIPDYAGKYYVKTLSQGKNANSNQAGADAGATPNAASSGSNANAYVGVVEKSRFVKPFGFRWIINYKMEVKPDSGDTEIFYLLKTSQIFDSDGNSIAFDDQGKLTGKKVSIDPYTIEDDTGGYPDESGFSYEVGQKGVRIIRILN